MNVAPGTGQLCEQSAVRTMNLDDIQLTYAVDGAMGLNPQVFFPHLPAEYWAGHPGTLTEHGQIAMSVGGLLVERGGRRLLIDAGLGAQRGQTPLGTVNSGALPQTLGDAFHIPAQLGHPEWPSLPDIDGNAVLAARRTLTQELERPDTLGFACHFGDQAFGRLTRTRTGLPGWEPVLVTPLMPAPRQLDS